MLFLYFLLLVMGAWGYHWKSLARSWSKSAVMPARWQFGVPSSASLEPPWPCRTYEMTTETHSEMKGTKKKKRGREVEVVAAKEWLVEMFFLDGWWFFEMSL